MTVTSLPFSSSTCRPSASAYLRPSWKMCPISMPRAVCRACPQSGHGSPSRISAAWIDAVGGEIPAGDQVDDVPAGLVGAGDPGRAARRRCGSSR